MISFKPFTTIIDSATRSPFSGRLSIQDPRARTYLAYMRLEEIKLEEVAKEQKRALEESKQREERVKLLSEWYGFSEERRKEIGNQLFPAYTTPEGGWTVESATKAGVLRNYSGQLTGEILESNFDRFVNRKKVDYDSEGKDVYSVVPSMVPAPTGGANDPLADIRKFERLAKEENYFGQNEELNTFVSKTSDFFEKAKASSTPKGIAELKAKALKEKIENTQIGSNRDELKRRLSTSDLKNTLRIGGVADTDETPVNIPT